MKTLLPGKTIGVFGSGQLGRMLGEAAHALGYRFGCYSPEASSPAAQIADFDVVGEYDDEDALETFLQQVDVVTFEFENVPAIVAQRAEKVGVPVHPAGRVLYTTQNRLREKEFLLAANVPTAPFTSVRGSGEAQMEAIDFGTPSLLKSAEFGYDGKGQVRINDWEDAYDAWIALDTKEAILETWVDFEREISVVAARAQDGQFAAYPPFENRHVGGILDVTLSHARIHERTARLALEAARTIFEALDIVGTACVEFFVLRDGNVLVNEIAPRPHNSGHLTIEAAPVSQFEQQARAICGLPLGETTVRPAAMAQILGDRWFRNGVRVEPNWQAAQAVEGVHLHLYGKSEPRIGRKMGHITALASTVEAAERAALEARDALWFD